jgi:lipase (class 3)
MANSDQPRDFALRIPKLAVSCIELCVLSYLAKATIGEKVNDPKRLPPLDPDGHWAFAAGPVENTDKANLAFVALYFAAPGVAPEFAVLVIRGTDLDVHDGWGIIQQLWEDLDVRNQARLPWAQDNPARIARGTLDAFDTIERVSEKGGQTLLDYLTALRRDPVNAGMRLIVTGHSLGGCLATVVAPRLQHKLGNLAIVPITFAAPTAGNAAFVAYYQDLFPHSRRYYSALDCVPRAWADLADIETLYAPCQLACPDLVKGRLDAFMSAMTSDHVSYVQPSLNAIGLDASCNPHIGKWSWYDEAGFQHHATTYLGLLTRSQTA